MEMWLWALLGIMAAIILALLIKIHLLQKAAREIETAFADRLMTDTNTLIDISTGDKYMRSLANAVNVQLRRLRGERRRFRQGDRELKNAVTNISHDLRTPITAICGYLDLLEQEDKSEAVKRYLEIIGNRTEILAQLTEELFRYSVIASNEENGLREPVAIGSILEESIAAFYTEINERGIVPDIKMPQSKVIRTLDPSALARVFSNLLSNAVKYSDGDLEITLSEKGEITFTNTASGLNEVQVGKLFDRFFTVEAARRSTGLGLSIARTLIEQMNGTISARYENGRLSVCIVLPDTGAES
ncbi:MAG: HAMP domain-containing histidine kinase [Firmicutes bacterium]|nr:HAMP domain-containing histidine kinase [Bacillota bacterium]